MKKVFIRVVSSFIPVRSWRRAFRKKILLFTDHYMEKIYMLCRSYFVKNKFDLIVGLGSWCQTSYQLRNNHLQFYSYPFDWTVVHDIDNLTRLIQNSFGDFLKKNNLKKIDQIDGELKVLDQNYQILFAHDFLGNHIDDDYKEVMDKYQRRIGRLNRHIQFSKKILFVFWWEHDDDVKIKKLYQALCDQYPQKDIHFWWIKHIKNQKRIQKTVVFDKIICYSFDTSYPYKDFENEWKGRDENYKKLYRNVSLSRQTILKLFKNIKKELQSE